MQERHAVDIKIHLTGAAMNNTIRLICGSVLLIAGCASIGPGSVVRDRFDYVAAISDSWKRQMLQNLLRIRNSDAPADFEHALCFRPVQYQKSVYE